MRIDSLEALRALYPPPSGRAATKQLDHLDRHCRRFIELSPFVVLASGSRTEGFDASPRGGEPGFVRVVDEQTLQVPDAPGNHRLDTLTNILETGELGLLFLIPGVDETLRVAGAARITADPAATGTFATERRAPKVVVEVAVREAFLHCAKAFMRSRLWAEESRRERSVLPSMGRMLADQTGADGPVETEAAMRARYRRDL